jgi:hypothetical protein
MKKYIHIVFLFFCILPNVFAQTGPGGVGKNDGSSALKLWFKADTNVLTATNAAVADNGKINTWKDASGNNVTATSTSDEKRPTWVEQASVLNNASALRFYNNADATNQFNGLYTSTYSVLTDATIFIVHYPITIGGSDDVTPVYGTTSTWFYGAGMLDADMPAFQNDFGLSYSSQSCAYGEGDPAASKDMTIKIPSPINQAYITAVTRDQANSLITLYSSATAAPVTYVKTIVSLSDPTHYAIGSTTSMTTYPENYYDGYIASIIVFNKKLNLAEFIIVQNYLSAKYNIPLQSNDFYTMDQNGNGDFDFNVAGIGMAVDGSTYTTSKGEGSVTMTNPTNLQANEFLFWGQNSGSISNFTKTNIPPLVKDRWEPIWRVSKSGGDLGKVDVIFDLPNANPSETKFLRIVQDLNNNGSFSDETESSFIAEAYYLGGTSYVFKNVQLQDGIRFTLARTNTFEEESKLSLTPNGDGINDVYTITSKKPVKIFDSSGNLVSQMQGPCTWDGSNQEGLIVNTGYYIIQIGDESYTGITVIH